jgi:ABC-type sugar transport system substrate-binding protein
MAPSVPNQLTEQVNMIESCIAGGFDGIATTLWDPDGFTDVIKKAMDAGIPVVGFNQDAPDSGRLSFVGQDMVLSGVILGNYMFGEVMKGEGKVIVTNCAPANTALIEREEGLQIALKDYPNIEYIESIDIGTDLTGAVGVIENAYMANPDVTAFIGVDVFSEAIGTFIESQGLTGKVKGGGYDLTEGTLNHIKNDNMQATIGQNPFLQGYYPMIILYLAKTFGYEPVNIDTGAFLVTAANVAAQNPE